jgi:outer membrane lipoprotein-sorting protein
MTRLSIALVSLVALAAPASAQDGPGAEELLAAIDEAVSSADVVQVEFASSAREGGEGGDVMEMSGEMILGAEGRCRMTFEGREGPNREFAMQMISDGQQRKVMMEQGGETHSEVEEVGEEDQAMMGLLRVSLSRVGTFLGFMGASGPVGEDQDFDAMFQIQQPERLEDAELDGEAVYVVRYLLVLESMGGETLDVTLWINPETGLPIKRNLSGKSDSGEISVSETYSVFAVDPDLDDDVFDLGGE